MQTTNTKRFLSFLFALLMVVSLVPAQAFAAETDTHEHSEAAETANPLDGDYQSTINHILDTYLETRTATETEIRNAVADMGLWLDARYEIAVLEETMLADLDCGSVTEEALEKLLADNETFTLFAMILEEKAEAEGLVMGTYAFTQQTTFFNGTLVFSQESTNNQAGSPFVTVKADSAVTINVRNPKSISNPKASTTVRMTNNSGKKATLKFTYLFTEETSGKGSVSITSSGKLTDSTGSTTDYSGDCVAVLDAGGTVDITITASGSLFKSNDNVLKLTAISFEAAADAANVTVNYDEAMGSAKIYGVTVAFWVPV